jgi:hypothetical protein
MAEQNAAGPKLPALIGGLGLAATYAAAVLLLGVLAFNLYLLLPGYVTPSWLALVVDAAPPLALLLSALAGYINYYGTWRILRRKDEYSAGSDLKSHAADLPGAMQGLPANLARRMGCNSLLTAGLLAISLVATGLTLAPPPLRLLGIAIGATGHVAPSPMPTPTPLVLNATLSSTLNAWDCNVQGERIGSATLILDNTGSTVDVSWTVTQRETIGVNPPVSWASAQPSQGTVKARQTQTITISPTTSVCSAANPSGTDYHADFGLTSAAGHASATFTYTIKGTVHVAFRLAPGQYPATGYWYCTQFPPAVTVTLDNTGSNVDVVWSVKMREIFPQTTTPWATVNQSQGMVPAGQTAQITITPDVSVCRESAYPPGTPWYADVTLTSGGSGVYTFTYTIAEQVIG